MTAPDGWVLVPREPTEEQTKAGAIATKDIDRNEHGLRVTRYLKPELLSVAYRAMIASAPPAPVPLEK